MKDRSPKGNRLLWVIRKEHHPCHSSATLISVDLPEKTIAPNMHKNMGAADSRSDHEIRARPSPAAPARPAPPTLKPRSRLHPRRLMLGAPHSAPRPDAAALTTAGPARGSAFPVCSLQIPRLVQGKPLPLPSGSAAGLRARAGRGREPAWMPRDGVGGRACRPEAAFPRVPSLIGSFFLSSIHPLQILLYLMGSLPRAPKDQIHHGWDICITCEWVGFGVVGEPTTLESEAYRCKTKRKEGRLVE
uniref:uncharacterized protein LOC114677135 n=1 Tax=Macaca mulatta TaxID=9544 RepID=UPI0010A25B37|nr:uncharacterized protein LOC114677135 [Macaca mulatta]